MNSFARFVPRPVRFLGTRELSGFRLKTYSIAFDEQPFEENSFEFGLELACIALPIPAITAERPGVGFLILHRGRTGNYLILCLWDRENELPTRVFIEDERGWRPASDGESFCVWDLEVMWREREAYVGTILSGKSFDDYLSYE